MCLVLFAKKEWKGFPILILANRDEFFERPAKAAEFWKDEPSLLAGRDLTSNGTWLGVTRKGRISFVTNRRDMREPKLESPISRGKLVENFLKSNLRPSDYEKQLFTDLHRYEGFNLFLFDHTETICISNKGHGTISIEPGVHTLSNAFWNTDWPKTKRLRESFEAIRKNHPSSDSRLPVELFFGILNDNQLVSDAVLPDTGIGPQREKLLSSIRISLPGYGTRVSTILAISDEGKCFFYEKTFEEPFSKDGTIVSFQFPLEP